MKKVSYLFIVGLLVFSFILPENLLANDALSYLSPKSSFPVLPSITSPADELLNSPFFAEICRILYSYRNDPPAQIKQQIQNFLSGQGIKQSPAQIDLNSIFKIQGTIYFLLKTYPEGEPFFVAVYPHDSKPELKYLKIKGELSSPEKQIGVSFIDGESVEVFLLGNYRYLGMQEKELSHWLKKFGIPKSELEFFVKMDEVKQNPILSLKSRKRLEGMATKDEKMTLKAFGWTYLASVAFLFLIIPNISSHLMAILANNAMIIAPVLLFYYLKRRFQGAAPRETVKDFWTKFKDKSKGVGKIFALSSIAYVITKFSTIVHEFGHWVLNGIAPWTVYRQMTIVWDNFFLGTGILAYVSSIRDPSLFNPADPLHRLLFVSIIAAGSFFEWLFGSILLAGGYRLRNRLPKTSVLLIALSLPIFLSAIQYPMATSALLSNLQIPDPSNDWFNFARFANTHLWNIILFFFIMPYLTLMSIVHRIAIRTWFKNRLSQAARFIEKSFRLEKIARIYRQMRYRNTASKQIFFSMDDVNKLPKDKKLAEKLKKNIHHADQFKFLALNLMLLPSMQSRLFVRQALASLDKTEGNLFLLRLLASWHIYRLDSRFILNSFHLDEESVKAAVEIFENKFPQENDDAIDALTSFIHASGKPDKSMGHAQTIFKAFRIEDNARERLLSRSSIKTPEWNNLQMSYRVKRWYQDRFTADFFNEKNYYFALKRFPDDPSSPMDYFIYDPGKGTKQLTAPEDIKTFEQLAKDYFLKVSHFNAGGTIDMNGETARRGVEAVKEMIAADSDLVATSRSLFKYSLDSSNIGPSEYIAIIHAIQDEIRRKRRLSALLHEDIRIAGGIVLNHGTDTIAETAFVLSEVFNGRIPFPIVVTGALLPPDQAGTDASENLKKAMEIAMTQTMPNLVYGVFLNSVYLGDRLFKSALSIDSESGNYIDSYGLTVGRFQDSELVLTDEFLNWWERYKKVIEKIPSIKGADGKTAYSRSETHFAYADHILITPQTSALDVQNAIQRARDAVKLNPNRPAAVILEGNLKKNANLKGILALLKETEKEPIIYFTENYGKAINTIQIPPYLPAWQARTLASLVFGTFFKEIKTVKKLKNETQRIFNRLLRPRRSKGHEREPLINETDPTFCLKAELVRAYPGMSSGPILDAIQRAKELNKKLLLIEGFGDGHIPIGTKPVGARLLHYLNKLKLGKNANEAKNIQKLIRKIRSTTSLEEAIVIVQRFLKGSGRNVFGALEIAESPYAYREIIENALIFSDPILAAVHKAKVEGIQIVMLSNVSQGIPNLNLYEVGMILKFLGAADLSAVEKMQGRLPLLGSEAWNFEETPPNRKPRILLLGAPVSGKSTQGKLLAKHFSIPVISIEKLLKNAAKNDPDFSKDIQRKLEKKDPLSRLLVTQLIRERLSQPDARDGFIMDDFPQDPAVVQILEEALSDFGQKLDAAVHLEVAKPVLRQRYEKIISTLRNPEIFEETYERELKEYEKNKEALTAFFQNRQNLVQVNVSNESADDQTGKLQVEHQIVAAIKNLPGFKKVSSTEITESPANSNLLEMAA